MLSKKWLLLACTTLHDGERTGGFFRAGQNTGSCLGITWRFARGRIGGISELSRFPDLAPDGPCPDLALVTRSCIGVGERASGSRINCNGLYQHYLRVL